MTRTPELPIERCLEDEDSLEHDVLDGLTRPFKELPPKHFYDARGSELFERICELPSYYPTRCERAILTERAGEIAERTGATELVELGSGAAEKARVLLTPGTYERYLPFDVSESALLTAAEELATEHPDLRVHGVVGDFERHLDAIPEREGPRVVALLGGTIGNFPPGSRRRMLEGVAGLLEPGDALVLGTDLVKDPRILEAAYDDPEGVTAEFNRNVLRVLNERLDGDAVPEAFDHVAFFDPQHEWIEMRLRSQRPQRFTLRALDLRVSFAAAEELRTEISCKFTPERIEADLASAGLRRAETWTDPDGLFAVQLAVPDA